MKFISIDLESDQPSGDIIQFGATVWDTDRPERPIDSLNIWRKKQVNWNHPLQIGITLGELIPYGQEKLEAEGLSLEAFWESVVSWLDSQNLRRIVQWGRGDWRSILKQTTTKIPKERNYQEFNLKSSYKNLLQPALRLPTDGKLELVVKALGLEFEGEPHDAYWDSYNTGNVLLELYKKINKCHQIEKIVHGK
jgi:hypothetical protein